MPEPEESKKGFWTTLPGVLTALAGLVGAIAAIVGLFVVPAGGGSDGGESSHSEWVKQANELCGQTAQLLRQLPPIDAYGSNFTQVAEAAARDERDLAGKLRALDAAGEDQEKIAHLTGLIDQQSNETDAAAVAWSQGDSASTQLHVQQVTALDPQRSAAAQALEVSACAQSPYPTGQF